MRIFGGLTLLALPPLANVAVAHPKLSDEQLAEYHANQARTTEALHRCLEAPHMKEIKARMVEEREASFKHVLKARGIETNEAYKKDDEALRHWANVNHQRKHGHSKDPQDLWDFRWSEPVHSLPGGACALSPETIYGPYWKGDQLERQDIRSGEKGVYMRLALQVIDVQTCMPLHGARVDVWQANALGEYTTKPKEALRGWQSTSPYGTADFDSIFPGHYAGRATHVHVLVRPEPSKRAVHVGMLYFDDNLMEAIEGMPQYIPNKAPKLRAVDDDIAPLSSSKDHDPFVQWAWLGNFINDGVLAWIAMGVNLTDTSVEQPKNPLTSLFDDHLDHSALH